jgi:UDP-glucuronate 4-epimerase
MGYPPPGVGQGGLLPHRLLRPGEAFGTVGPMDGPTLTGARILVTGPTGQVALPVTLALAADNDVIGIARFRDVAARARLESAGVTCIETNLAADDFEGVPDDVDYVLNLAVVKSNRWDIDLAANAEATGLLMARCRSAKAWLQCSSTGVYQPAGLHPLLETDSLGDNHRPIMETYSIAKIAAETVARFGARQWNLPVTVARLNVPYGDNGGWPAFHLAMIETGQAVPVHPDRPNRFNPIHESDIIRMIPRLLEIASVPATTVNWGGSQPVDLEEWCALLGELTGNEVAFVETEETIGSVVVDTTKMHELVGDTEIDWRDGMRRMVEAQHRPST